MDQSVSRKAKAVKVLLYTVLIIICILSLFPFYWALVSSFRSDVDIFKYVSPFSWRTLIPDKISFASYVSIFTTHDMAGPIVRTLLVALLNIALGLVINGFAGFAFAKFNFKGKNLLFAIILVSAMLPFEAIAIPLYGIVNQLQWIDTYWALLVPTAADGLVIFMFRQFFQDIPDSIIESARLDGASWTVTFWKIVAPLSVPVFVTSALMIFITQWGAFMWPLLAAHDPSIRLIQVALTDFNQEHGTLWSELYATSVITSIIPVLLFLPFQKYYVAGITSSGVKG
jgi:ABC-type glycerol-3-phosphate transport system permease component